MPIPAAHDLEWFYILNRRGKVKINKAISTKLIIDCKTVSPAIKGLVVRNSLFPNMIGSPKFCAEKYNDWRNLEPSTKLYFQSFSKYAFDKIKPSK